ncbi:hypothetical protein ACUM6W_02840 [Acinetobacter tandoii]|uniref:hypothetical protein n=1 Tax=Acinetobacter tandoii TaxID=202954 RepID=UPI004045F239
MKLLSSLDLNSHQSRFKECKVGLDNDYDEIIKAFNPDLIMAEHIGENTVVLEQAIKIGLHMVYFILILQRLTKS